MGRGVAPTTFLATKESCSAEHFFSNVLKNTSVPGPLFEKVGGVSLHTMLDAVLVRLRML